MIGVDAPSQTYGLTTMKRRRGLRATIVYASMTLGVGCYSSMPELTSGGATVILSPNAPSVQGFDVRQCRSLGVIAATGGGHDLSMSEYEQSATIQLRNAAAARGSNYVQYDSPQLSVDTTVTRVWTNGATISGTAYRCEGVAGQPAAQGSDAQKAPPTGAGGFTLGSTVEIAQAACETKYQWAPAGADVFECSGTPRPMADGARATLRFCDRSLCRAVFVIRPDSDQSSVWVHEFSRLRKTLEGKYGDPLEERVVPDDCANDVLPCIRSGKAHVKYVWKFTNQSAIGLVFSNATGSDPVIRLTYAIDRPDAPAL
jgi:hypothetical protein